MKTNQLANSAPRQLSLSSIARDNDFHQHCCATPVYNRAEILLSVPYCLLTANKGKYLYQTDQCAPKTGTRGRYDKYRTVRGPHQVRSP